MEMEHGADPSPSLQHYPPFVANYYGYPAKNAPSASWTKVDKLGVLFIVDPSALSRNHHSKQPRLPRAQQAHDTRRSMPTGLHCNSLRKNHYLQPLWRKLVSWVPGPPGRRCHWSRTQILVLERQGALCSLLDPRRVKHDSHGSTDCLGLQANAPQPDSQRKTTIG